VEREYSWLEQYIIEGKGRFLNPGRFHIRENNSNKKRRSELRPMNMVNLIILGGWGNILSLVFLGKG
jgi:hypothetical protein